mgnify:CR=1 FL=1
MSEQSKALAENICALFGKAYQPQGHPDMGGIEDKVLTDVIMLIDGMLRTHYGPLEADRDSALADHAHDTQAIETLERLLDTAMRDAAQYECERDALREALRDAIADARSNADALQHAEIQLAQSVCAEEHRQVMAERDEARAQVITDCNVLNQEIDEARSLIESLNGQNIELAKRLVAVQAERNMHSLRRQKAERERDEARANAAALKKECEAWRRGDSGPESWDRDHGRIEARRMRDANEGDDRG